MGRPATRRRQSGRSVRRQTGKFEAVNGDRVSFGSNLEGEIMEGMFEDFVGIDIGRHKRGLDRRRSSKSKEECKRSGGIEGD